jgi:hypothetical protein
MTTKGKPKKKAVKTVSKSVSSKSAKTTAKAPAKSKKVTKSSKPAKKLDVMMDNDFDLDLDMEDLYSMGEGLTITAPSQPLEYRVVVANSADELTKMINELLFVAHDGTVWVPQGGVCVVANQWSQAMARFE